MEDANAYYSRDQRAVLFGYLPAAGGLPALYTCLAHDVIAHEVTHAVLDGLRPRLTEPGLPDQPAFHEALADIVAILSVFNQADVVKNLLDVSRSGTIPNRFADADELKNTPLLGLAEQLGQRLSTDRATALRRSVELPATTEWQTDPAFADPHRLGEVLVAAVMHTLVRVWSERIADFKSNRGMDADRVAEEGAKAAGHVLAMCLRALDYMPPVELEYSDVVDSILTADERVAPEDDHHYRDTLSTSFAAFGIVVPEQGIVDYDKTSIKMHYGHLNFNALRTAPEEVYRFLWANADLLGIDLSFPTRVERVIQATRVGPDGLVVNEVLADYTQTIETTAARLPPGMDDFGLPRDARVQIWGGGVLVFDQFGRFRLHQAKDVLDVERQNRRLRYLVEHELHDGHGNYGATTDTPIGQRFASLHGVEFPAEGW
jgi:hypothetical protein